MRSNTCMCGHSKEEHGHDPRHPASTSCTECTCIAYEADEDEADEDEADEDEADEDEAVQHKETSWR